MRARPATSPIVAAALLATGCSSERPWLSSDVATRDIAISVTARGDAAATRVEAQMVGDTRVHLVPGDRIELHAGTTALVMSEAGDGVYQAALPPGVTELEIRLERPEPDEDASLRWEMPPATSITSAPQASRGEPLTVTWTASAGPHTTTLDVSGSCLPPLSRELSVDPGSYTFQPADLMGPSAEPCEATVTLRRALNTHLSPALLRPSNLAATQIATTTFESIP